MARKSDNPTTPLDNPDADRPAEGSGLHDATPREVRIDKSYVERPYSEAMTSEQKQALTEAGLL